MPLEPVRRLKNYRPSRFKAPGSIYKESFADSAVMFVNQLKHTQGRWWNQPFELIGWQEQILRDLFGIVHKSDECRQFRRAYIELPKKNGKSELAAAVALLLTCCDFEQRGQVYGCAVDRQQASIVFDVAMHMVELWPGLKSLMKLNIGQKRMTFKPLDSYYEVVSADFGNKDGLNAHGIIFDELHAQKNRAFFDVMTGGSGFAREQPLTFIITTAGTNRESICWEQHRYADQVAKGIIDDPTFYPLIYGAEEDADWQSEQLWREVNPSLGITIDPEQFLREFLEAKLNPVKENKFRQSCLNQWVKQSIRWMPMHLWDACAFEIIPSFLKGRSCYAGLDLSRTQDMTAFVLVFPPEDDEGKYIIVPHYWLPKDNLEQLQHKSHVSFDKWVAEGLLTLTEGIVIDYKYIKHKIAKLAKLYDIREIAYDAYGAKPLVQDLEDAGLAVTGFGQGYKSMSPPSIALFRLVAQKKIAHGGHPILRWNFDNVIVKIDEASNIKPDREKVTEKIDGAVAAIMALGRAIDDVDEPQGGLVTFDGTNWYRNGELWLPNPDGTWS
jgi:phage terminase large subunit-like protein